jgi:hypothetical protein
MDLKKRAELEAKQIELFKATAAMHTPEGYRAYRAFAASLTGPILKKVEEQSYMRQLFTTIKLAIGQQPSFPIADDFDSPIWILPSLGYVAQDTMELGAEEVLIPIFTIQAAKNWMLKYAEEGRVDIVTKAQQAVADAIASYEEEAGWRVIIPAVTSAFDGAGILPPRPAPIYEMPAGDSAAGYFSKELINRMIVGMQRIGRNLNSLWISPEDMADIREYTETDVDPVTRRGIFEAAGLGSIWGVNFRVVNILGVRGKYNINDKTSEFGPFRGSQSPSNKFNDYSITHGNVLDENGALVTAGETQIYGFDNSDVSLVMMIREEYQAHDDPSLHRRQQQGFYGWSKFGMACLDARFMCLGIIDRYTPEA